MKRLLLKLAVAAGLVSTLAACNDDNNNTATATPTTTTTTTTTATPRFAALGTGFSTDFATAASTEPKAVAAGDVVAVNNTSEPSSVS